MRFAATSRKRCATIELAKLIGVIGVIGGYIISDIVHTLPVQPPILPMLAKRVGELPVEGSWIFEPKWDGFRALVFRDEAEILIQSRDEKPLNRYFPELIEPLQKSLPARCVLDGELVITKQVEHGHKKTQALDFDALQLRLH